MKSSWKLSKNNWLCCFSCMYWFLIDKMRYLVSNKSFHVSFSTTTPSADYKLLLLLLLWKVHWVPGGGVNFSSSFKLLLTAALFIWSCRTTRQWWALLAQQSARSLSALAVAAAPPSPPPPLQTSLYACSLSLSLSR